MKNSGSYIRPGVSLTPALSSSLDLVGNTPLIRLDRLASKYGIKCTLYAKCEFFNAGGSIKDRTGLNMLLAAEKSGRIKPGDTLVGPTSGNTGISLALGATLKGYKSIICIPEKMSDEKINTLAVLGAKLYKTPTECAWNDYDSHISLAARLEKDNEGFHVLDQYGNQANPDVHEFGTGPEIVKQIPGKIDALVASAGTGGTITGLSRALKKAYPKCKVWGVDPYGSILAEPHSVNMTHIYNKPYYVEGIGYDFIPDVLKREYVDEWIKTEDKEAFLMARDCIRTEGLLVGGSSGSALVGAIKVGQQMKSGETLVVILPDSCRNYMSKFMSDNWMIEKGFMEPPPNPVEDKLWGSYLVKDLPFFDYPTHYPISISSSTICSDACTIMDVSGMTSLAVVDSKSHFAGVLTYPDILAKLRNGTKTLSDPVSKFKDSTREAVEQHTPLRVVSRILEFRESVVVIEDMSMPIPIRILTQADLIKFQKRRLGSSRL